ncbi:MAG TPA: coproporphyrinogen III oxidase [Bacteroidales bacterium]|nr:coproporphyrinogen III oxidase [Bacteroidales bacterium]
MAGVYIHIPFCRQACHYCNFHFSVSLRKRNDFLECLLAEMEMRHNFFGNSSDDLQKSPIQSVYLGGGTPSLLGTDELNQIFEGVSKYFAISPNAEITIEANPDDLTFESLSALRQTPVNRLSIGVQSFHHSDLLFMNRAHTPAQAISAIENAKECGFQNLTIDLIYGTPTLSDSQWIDNLRRTLDLGVEHISAYALTVEPRTALDVLIRKGKAAPVDEEQTAMQFEIMVEILESKGYMHYEISNFALPGKFSQHNLSYWIGEPYLGLGPSAHSFHQNRRSWNIANTAAYIQSIRNGILPLESENLTLTQRYDEYLMTSLRTMWGCSLQKIEQQWGSEKMKELKGQCKPFLENGLMVETDHYLILTKKGRLFADRIASDLFWV